MKNLLFICCWLYWSLGLSAQSSTNAPLHDDNHKIIDRLQIRTGDFNGLHTFTGPLTRKDIVDYKNWAESESTFAEKLKGSKRYQEDLRYITNDNNDTDTSVHSRKPFLKYFYRTPAHLFEVRTKAFYFNINPIFHLKFGYEMRGNGGGGGLTFLNRRGAEIRGNIADKVYFYTSVTESQARFPTYVTNRVDRDFAIPGAGFFKQYDSRLTPQADDGFDYLVAQGYVGFNATKYIGIQLGHGTNFIGDGHRSLFLSDYAPNYFYLKLNTRVWKIQYQNIFAELTQNYTPFQRAQDDPFPKKYMAAHHLSINILKNLNIGLFESVIFSRGGSMELQYLNPIIFYRAVEQAVGSPDNVMIGLNWKYNFLKTASFYGQFVLDELSIGDISTNGFGWWGNKFGLQAGLKYIDAFGLDHLDLQVEYNMVRPYTYTFRDSTAIYNHYHQPLAHPLGANFHEVTAIVNYQPIPKLNIRAQMNYAQYGQDTLGSNWGSNLNPSYFTREQENNNKIGQGVKTNLLWFQLWVSYQIRHNLYADLQFTHRNENATLDALDNSANIISLGIRWNIAERNNDW
ncbi:MAG: hypothetical protein GY810_32500 [Aureispira sp.]|nr:hypothetical protein [Aureispira sp.]